MKCPSCGSTAQVTVGDKTYCTNCGSVVAVLTPRPADAPVAAAVVATPTPIITEPPAPIPAVAKVSVPVAAPAPAVPAKAMQGAAPRPAANRSMDMRPARPAAPRPTPVTVQPVVVQPTVIAAPVVEPAVAESVAPAITPEPVKTPVGVAPAAVTPPTLRGGSDDRREFASQVKRSSFVSRFSAPAASTPPPLPATPTPALTPAPTPAPAPIAVKPTPPAPAPVLAPAAPVHSVATPEPARMTPPPRVSMLPRLNASLPSGPAPSSRLDRVMAPRPVAISAPTPLATTTVSAPPAPRPVITPSVPAPAPAAAAPVRHITMSDLNVAGPTPPAAIPGAVIAPKTPVPAPANGPALPNHVATQIDNHDQLTRFTNGQLARAANPIAMGDPLRSSTPTNAPKPVAVLATVMAVVVMGGYIWLQNYPKMALHTASGRAGFTASLPSAIPANYSLNGPINSKPGLVSFELGAPGANNLTVTQRATSWDSIALLDNYVTTKSNDYLAVQGQGLTIYLYGNNQAAWVNHGIWYSIEGATRLSRDQVLKMAYSL